MMTVALVANPGVKETVTVETEYSTTEPGHLETAQATQGAKSDDSSSSLGVRLWVCIFGQYNALGTVLFRDRFCKACTKNVSGTASDAHVDVTSCGTEPLCASSCLLHDVTPTTNTISERQTPLLSCCYLSLRSLHIDCKEMNSW